MYLATKGEMKRFLENEAQVAAFKNAGYEISEVGKAKSAPAETDQSEITVADVIEAVELDAFQAVVTEPEAEQPEPKKAGRPKKEA